MHYLIAYDIADPRRLRRVARFLERQAQRCQRSVFWLRTDPSAVRTLLEGLRPILDPARDLVQAWRLAPDEHPTGLVLGTPVPVESACLIAGAGPAYFVGVAR